MRKLHEGVFQHDECDGDGGDGQPDTVDFSVPGCGGEGGGCGAAGGRGRCGRCGFAVGVRGENAGVCVTIEMRR